jgi:hypothetical protein
MSADEFDPAIERLFARTPTMPDAALFTARVEQRMQKGSRMRVVVLGLAGLVGGVVAVREVVSVNFNADGGGLTAGMGQGQSGVRLDERHAAVLDRRRGPDRGRRRGRGAAVARSVT